MINDVERERIAFQEDIRKSEYFNNLVVSEFLEISKGSVFLEDAISLRQKYVYHNEDIIEFGVFLVNNTNLDMNLETLPLFLTMEKRRVKRINYNIKKFIAKKSAVFIEIIVENSLDIKKEEYDLLKVALGDLSDIVIENNIDINHKALSKGEKYADLKDLRSFIKKLPKIKREKLHIDCYRMDCIEENFHIVLVLRNSSDEGVNIKSLPVAVVDNKGLLLYRRIFTFEDNQLLVDGRGIKIAVLTIPKEDIVITSTDFANYKVNFN